MPPRGKKVNQAISAYVYQKDESTTPPSPLKPAEPVLMPRYVKHITKWAPKQNRNYVELVTRGIYLSKEGVIVSNLIQATDYMEGTLQIHSWEDPAPLLYVRPKDVQRSYDSATPRVKDLTTATLPSSIKVLPDHLASLSRELFSTVMSTMPDDVDQSDYEDQTDGCGITLLPILFQEAEDGIDGDAGDAIEAVILSLCQLGPA